MSRRGTFIKLSLAIVAIISVAVWYYYVNISDTRVALVNFPDFQAVSIARSVQGEHINVDVVGLDGLHKVNNYDAVLVFAMGIKYTGEQRQILSDMAIKGLPVYSTSVTNPDNDIVSLDSTQIKVVSDYLGNGGKANYRSLLRYIRTKIDKKKWFVNQPDEVVTMPKDAYYHLNDELSFSTLDEFQKFRKKEGWQKDGAPIIAIVGSIGDPFAGNRMHLDSLIASLEKSGLNVYPMASVQKRLEMLKELKPDAVIYLPHGRLSMGTGNVATEWLKENNIPLFCPVTVLETEEKWMNDPMGMMGGFLSQSVVIPELDGGIYPYVLNAQYKDDDGFYVFRAIPDRLNSFVRIVNNFIKLKKSRNSDKKIAVYYFKGAGQSALVASGMEVIPSLYNFLQRLKSEGYNLGDLPSTEGEFEKLVKEQGVVLGEYARGAFNDYIKGGNPALVEKFQYESWVSQAMSQSIYSQVVENYGPAPGDYLSFEKDGKKFLAVARLQFGNVAVLPQPLPAVGNNQFQLVHGAKISPPHTYIGSYLWSRFEFKADAIIHFGTHGSLEFTPQKQVALSSNDWPDRLIGTMPHFYLYTIANVGEGIIAKRRGYATLISHLNPPFMESDMRGEFKSLNEKIRIYHDKADNQKNEASLRVKKIAVKLGLHRDLGLDSILTKPYNIDEIGKIENFAEELANEKMMGQPYTLGKPYEKDKVESSVIAMSADPIAYSIAALDRENGTVTSEQLQNKQYFTRRYLNPSKSFVNKVLSGSVLPNDAEISKLAGLKPEDLEKAREFAESLKPKSMAQVRAQRAANHKANKPNHPEHKTGAKYKPDAHSGATPKDSLKVPPVTYKNRMMAILEIDRTVKNILLCRSHLYSSPQGEINALLNALNGGYISPSPGGDAVANPNTLPTGRNLFSVNAEATPSESAWEKGVNLAKSTLDTYMKRNGRWPKKVSYTFWSGEFIETEGATIAQVLYMLGVEPVRDAFGRVSDLRLIPAKELGRPRIDVVVQTSGQFRDLGASRLMLISRAVEMAASAPGDDFDNYVKSGTVETQRLLIEKGATPQNAKQMSLLRIFGGVNGNYGAGITGMVESGDKWENEVQLAKTYLHNMGASYDNDKDWGELNSNLLEAVLHNTDIVVQPRQNNTWGPISLDHVYEFMGGMNLAVRNVTGKDPDAYFSDYRNRNNVRIQEVKEAIGVESRTTIFNPAYIREQLKGGASSAENFSVTVRNIYGWNVMKPKAIDNEMWDKIYQVYVKDEYNLNVKQFFEKSNPAALQEITAVMLETARKGYWKATQQQLEDIARLHTQLIEDYNPGCTGFICDNSKLKDFIANNIDPQMAKNYQSKIANIRETNRSNDNGTVMKREELSTANEFERQTINGLVITVLAILIFIGLGLWLKRKRKNEPGDK